MLTAIGLTALLCLAFANGANDNAKPVATLVGAGLAGPRRALLIGTLVTLIGSLCAIALGSALVARFSAKGLVDAQIATQASFQVSVAVAAALTVLLATRLGLPISTTHALVGALVGAGMVVTEVDFARLGSAFALPLLISPVAALGATALLYPLVHRWRKKLGISRHACVCVGSEWVPVYRRAGAAGELALERTLSVSVDDPEVCRERYRGAVLGIESQALAQGLHWLSALGVSFARGLQDGAKIAGIGIILAGASYGVGVAAAVAVFMAAGGLLAARRVEETMATRITSMNDGQALLSNLLSAVLILGASHVGMPVSTTHVTTGALVGLRAHTDAPSESWLGRILLSWVATLPLAAALAAIGVSVLA